MKRLLTQGGTLLLAAAGGAALVLVSTRKTGEELSSAQELLEMLLARELLCKLYEADETAVGLRRALNDTMVPSGVTVPGMKLDEVILVLERIGAVIPLDVMQTIADAANAVAVATFTRLHKRGELAYWAGRIVSDPEQNSEEWLATIREQLLQRQL